MLSRSSSLALVLILAATRAGAQAFGGSGGVHDHSTNAKGGTALAPKTLNIAAGSTETVNGYFNVSSGAALNVASGVSMNVAAPSTFTGTAVMNYPVGMWATVAYSKGHGGFTFSGLVSTQTYNLILTVAVTSGSTTGEVFDCQINGDSGANYYWVASGYCSSNNATSVVSVNGGGYFIIYTGRTVATQQANDIASFNLILNPSPSNPKYISVNGSGEGGCGGLACVMNTIYGGFYVGTATAMNSIRCFNSASMGADYEARLVRMFP